MRHLLRHVAQACPEEACGVLVQEGGRVTAVPITNTASDPINTFRLDPAEYLAQFSRTVAIYHSHPRGTSKLSSEDRLSAEVTGLPHVVVGLRDRAVRRYLPAPVPYEDRPFFYGLFDTLSVIEDWWRFEQGVELPETARPLKGRPEVPYQVLGVSGQRRPGDVIMFTTGHAALYVGKGRILHHPAREVSRAEPLGKSMQSQIKRVVRYIDAD